MNEKIKETLLTEFNFLSEKEISSLICEMKELYGKHITSENWQLNFLRNIIKERYGLTILIKL